MWKRLCYIYFYALRLTTFGHSSYCVFSAAHRQGYYCTRSISFDIIVFGCLRLLQVFLRWGMLRNCGHYYKLSLLLLGCMVHHQYYCTKAWRKHLTWAKWRYTRDGKRRDCAEVVWRKKSVSLHWVSPKKKRLWVSVYLVHFLWTSRPSLNYATYACEDWSEWFNFLL